MKNDWITVNKSLFEPSNLPENGEEVLTYFWDKGYDVDQFQILTYFKKGEKFDLEEPFGDDIIGNIYGKHNRVVEEDGFYIFDSTENGQMKYRKHANVITHWQPLEKPSRD